MRLHLVRHGPPRIDPQAPPHEWSLDGEARDAVLALASSGVLPDDVRWLSSDEPKAVQTAEMLAEEMVSSQDVEQVPGLREQRRPAGWIDDYAVRVHRSLVREDEPSSEGWETSAETRQRVTGAVRDAVSSDDEAVLVGHGTAWTLLVSELTGTPVDLVAWERMSLPDHCVVEDGTVVSDWGAWTSGALPDAR
ncbi:MAG TPA: histidine phosphatase family protein [Actinomycetales bacterium]|nr:histidine phosphatase family protein [Actinomycetales bacterium]